MVLRSPARTATPVPGDLPFLVESAATPMRDDAPDQPGTAVSGYRIERLIGMGGMAAVYEARRLGRGGPGEPTICVACKVMHADRHADPRDRELVRQEAVLGLRITAGHPNLVRVLDYFDDAQDQRCIVMELVDGMSAAELRGPARRLPAPVIRRIAHEVLAALVYLHGLGVLHRDLSPRNVLVSAGGAVKVADFGIAKVMEQGQVHTRTFRGTLAYASPEAIQCVTLDARADLFTLGAVLFDLVSGIPPCGKQDGEAMVAVLMVQGKYQPLPPDAPADLAELIAGLLRTARDERWPQTAVEALSLLRRHDQPMASPAELAALIKSAKARRATEIVDDRPAYALAPGHVLAPRMSLASAPKPNIPASRPDAPEPATGGMIRMPLRAPGRAVSLRVAGVAGIVACSLVLGFLINDGFRAEQDAVERQQPNEAPASVSPTAVTPARAEAAAKTGDTTEPRRSTQRMDGAQRRRTEVQRDTRPTRRRAVPHESEPPPWGRR